jgi:hypothetical protein
MKKRSMLWVLTIVWLIALISTAGCITLTVPKQQPAPSTTTPVPTLPPTTTPAAQGYSPVVNSFTASPDTISAGQSATISWNVSDATSVTIQPAVGSVGSSGTQQVSPTRTTTYNLTATNAAGSTTGTLTLTVTPAAAGMPDLVVTEISANGSIIFYKMKNQGSAAAPGSRSYLYVNNPQVSTDYVEPLAAGEERVESFSNYAFLTGGYSVGAGQSAQTPAFDVKVCADAENAAAESNENNNCLDEILGEPQILYDFVKSAHLATWRSGAGELEWPMVSSETKGAAFVNSYSALEDGATHGDALATYPQHTNHGVIQGVFGEMHQENIGQLSQLTEVTIPAKAKFTAKVGFVKDAEAPEGATVSFGIQDPSGSIVFLSTKDIHYDGALDTIEADLSSYAGQKVFFVLRVEAKGSGDNAWVIWVEPEVVQGV